ncbi:MAG: glycosyltransferase, partial [Solirubrobacteraceae bacterium]
AHAIMAGHREDVMAVLAASDLVVQPTVIDAYPTVLLEAAAAGVPVIASRVGGIPEIVRHGESGLLLDPPVASDQLARTMDLLLADAALRARMGEQARRRYHDDFTASAWALRLAETYRAVLEAYPRAPSARDTARYVAAQQR